MIIPTTSGKPFCQASSEDPMFSSNLQLFSLQQAFRYWRILVRRKSHLSPSQTLNFWSSLRFAPGPAFRNCSDKNAKHSGLGTHVQTPKPLFDQVLGISHLRRTEFRTFIDTYDDCRHFGSPKYPSVAALTEANCRSSLDLVVHLWNEIVSKYINSGNDPGHKLADFNSVRDLVNV